MDYDQEIKLISSTHWMAEWSRAPALPPREVGGAGDHHHRNIFCVLLASYNALCKVLLKWHFSPTFQSKILAQPLIHAAIL